MSRIRVAIRIAAQPSEVWADLAEISRHVEWMRDAVALTFTSASSRGVGTTFDCLTQIGPIRLTDRMEITAWDEGRSIGVRHVGIGTGEGTIRLRRSGRRHTRVTWSERLAFPWYLGGPVGAWVAAPALTWVWRGSMRNLRRRFEPT